MVLGNIDIVGLQESQDGKLVEPYDPRLVNPASYNLRLGNSFLRIAGGQQIGFGDPVEYEETVLQDGETFILKPGEFVLGTTIETIRIPINVAAFVQGRSSIGRIGLVVQNAGFVDPGFCGEITLELLNTSPCDIALTPGFPVAQLVFMSVFGCDKAYSGKYVMQSGATGSRMFMDGEWSSVLA